MTSTKWTYGEEGTAFPVRVGEVWRCAGHTFVCSDLMESRLLDTMLNGPTIVYTDPPWGQALLNGFRTKAGLGKADYRWEALYERISTLAPDVPLWIEGSKAEHRDGQKIPSTLTGRKVHEYYEVKYYGKNPSGLYYGHSTPPPAHLKAALWGEDDDDTPGIVMAAYGRTGLVVDPCAGRGQTSRQAQNVGWVSVNNELNPNRVSAALSRMQKMTGEEPERWR